MTEDEITQAAAHWPHGEEGAPLRRRLIEDMHSEPDSWWSALRSLVAACNVSGDAAQLGWGPLAALLGAAPSLKPTVAAVGRQDSKTATALVEAVSPEEGYFLLGRPSVTESWRRHAAATRAARGTARLPESWDFWAWDLYLRWSLDPTPTLWPALLHLLQNTDEAENVQIGIDYLEDLLRERPSEYVALLLQTCPESPRLRQAVCLAHLPAGYEEQIYEGLGRRPTP